MTFAFIVLFMDTNHSFIRFICTLLLSIWRSLFPEGKTVRIIISIPKIIHMLLLFMMLTIPKHELGINV